MGDFVAGKLEMEKDELPIYMVVTDDYAGHMLFFFENGRVSKVEMSAYQTKTNRKKLIKAYCDKFPITSFAYAKEEGEYLLRSTNGRMLLLSTAVIVAKSAKDTQGIVVMTQKRGQHLCEATKYTEGLLDKPHRYRPRTLPGAGQLLSAEERGEQLMFE